MPSHASSSHLISSQFHPSQRPALRAAPRRAAACARAWQVRTAEGPAKLNVSKSGVSLKSRFFKATTVLELSAELLKVDVHDPSALTLAPVGGKAIPCTLSNQQARDLIVLVAKAFTSLGQEPSFEGPCRVWEGDGYGDYHGQIFGNVMLLFEGENPPTEGTEPSEALMLHGSKAENVEP
jgi:hypothetical protein